MDNLGAQAAADLRRFARRGALGPDYFAGETAVTATATAAASTTAATAVATKAKLAGEPAAAAAEVSAHGDDDEAHAAEAEAVEVQAASIDERDDRRLFTGMGSSAGSTGETPAAGVGGGGGGVGAATRRLARCWRGATQPVVVLLWAYALLNLGMVGSIETWPLYLMRNGTGGLGMPPHELGTVMLPQSSVVMLMPLAYPLIARRLGDRGTFLLGAASLVLFASCMPLLRFVKATPEVRRRSRPRNVPARPLRRRVRVSSSSSRRVHADRRHVSHPVVRAARARSSCGRGSAC